MRDSKTTINIQGESYRLKDRRRAGLLSGRDQEGPTAVVSVTPAFASPKTRRPKAAALGSALPGATESRP